MDYGIVQLSLDGDKLGTPIDLFNNSVIPTGELDLGTRDLAAGEHFGRRNEEAQRNALLATHRRADPGKVRTEGPRC